MAAPSVQTLAQALDEELRVADFAGDSSHNGLQVANSGSVRRICCGVDASLEFFERAADRGAGLCIVHHGLSWGDSLARITGLNHRWLDFLIRNDLALYAAHLPLDAHPRLGNNARLAEALGLSDVQPFGDYHGMTIGVRGRFAQPLSRGSFRERLAAATPQGRQTALEFGPEAIRGVGVVSGGGADALGEALEGGLDAFVTGEVTLAAYNTAKQGAINAYFAGHYATETFGVRAAGDWLGRRFGVPCEWIDLGLPY